MEEEKKRKRMAGYSENNPTTTRARILQGLPMEGGKSVSEVGNNRRVLRDIKNFVGAPPPYPCAVIKRGLLDKSTANDKNQKIVHRPMTRKFAASLANGKLPQNLKRRNDIVENEKTKKGTQSIPSSNNLDSSTAIDVEEYMETDESLLPSFVKHTEAILEEMEKMNDCELKEVEMEDIVVKAVDIDSFDSNNPLAVVDYVQDIFTYYRQIESCGCVYPNYMSNQFDINERMRAILIDWLIEVHYKFELMDETLFMTVNLIDRFLEQQTILRKKLQLVGITALLLACKYEEVSVPVVEDLILISDKAYTRDEVLAMEKMMVNTLQFNMSVPTSYVFMRRFLKAAESDKKLELLSFFMIELCLVEYEMLKFRPSLLAAAAIYTAQCTLRGSRHWSRTSEWYTNYSEEQLLECSKLMVDFHKKAAVGGKLTGVQRKYNTYKFGYAAKAEPALFLLNMMPSGC